MAAYPTEHVNEIPLKCEIVWTGGLLHLPGVAHLHVNRPLDIRDVKSITAGANPRQDLANSPQYSL